MSHGLLRPTPAGPGWRRRCAQPVSRTMFCFCLMGMGVHGAMHIVCASCMLVVDRGRRPIPPAGTTERWCGFPIWQVGMTTCSLVEPPQKKKDEPSSRLALRESGADRPGGAGWQVRPSVTASHSVCGQASRVIVHTAGRCMWVSIG